MTDALPITAEEASAVPARCAHPVDLNFFGVEVRLWVTSSREADQWRYFYKYHLGQGSDPDVELFFEVDGRRDSFIESIFRKDYSSKSMYIRRRNAFVELWARFDRWSGKPSPLPPYTLPPLNQRVWALNASAVRTPSGSGMVFAASPYQGKSTLANAVVERGGSPLSDNVTMISKNAATILPYLTPTGVREETISKLPALAEAVRNMHMPFTTVSEVTGKVYLLHFDEISAFPRPQPSPLSDIIFLENRRGKLGRRFELVPLDTGTAWQELSTFAIDTNTGSFGLGVARQRPLRARQLIYDLSGCELTEVVDAILE